jgi:hypothetical protein
LEFLVRIFDLSTRFVFKYFNFVAPAAIGPYSQAVEVDGILYISGQLGIDPGTMNLVEGGVIPQTQQAFKNIQEILRAAHADFKVGSYMVVCVKRFLGCRQIVDFLVICWYFL